MKKPAILGGDPVFDETIVVPQPTTPKIDEIRHYLEDILERKWLSNEGSYVKRLERELSKYVGAKCLAVSNGTKGLELSLEALKLKGEVILPSFTFPATAHAVVRNNLKPVFADIDLETYNLNPKSVEESITNETSAVMGVHVFGNPCDVAGLKRICDKNGIALIFDSAEAIGSSYCGKKIGCYGDIEVFSLHATKALMSGEGGFVASNREDVLEYIEAARNFGFKKGNNYDTIFAGTNAKMAEIPAALGLWSLSKLDDALKGREGLAKKYIELLGKLAGIKFQKTTENASRTYQFFSILIEKDFGLDRDWLAKALEMENISTKKYFHPIHLHSAYTDHKDISLPVTESISKKTLCLPLYSHLGIENVEKICDAIKNIHEHRKEITRLI